MTKIIPATCVGGVVKIGDLVISEVTLLTQGTKSSEGFVVLDGALATYIASNAMDLADTIDLLGQIIQKIILIVTAHDTAPIAVGGAAANIALLTTLNVQLGLTKENLA